MEELIKSELPVIQGCTTIFIGNKPLKIRVNKKSFILFASSENSWMESSRKSLKKINPAFSVFSVPSVVNRGLLETA